MIAVSTRGRSFRSLAAYLVRKKDGAEQSAVAWTAGRNLPTHDPELAAVFMHATAEQNVLVNRASYHLMVSFAPDDPVDRAMMERVGDRLLAGLGLGEHEAVLVAHQDRPHPHLHIMVNRVHPGTGRVWKTWLDWRQVRQILREEERALGLPTASILSWHVNALARDVRSYERVIELGDEQYRAHMEASAARALGLELELAAQRAHTTLARSDRALAAVYRDPEVAYRAYVAAADERGVRQATQLMRERPEQFGALRTVERSRGFGLWHASDRRSARAAAPAASFAASDAIEAVQAWRNTAESAAQRADQAFERALGAVYQDPAAARSAFDRLAAERGVEQAAAALRERPVAFGPLRATADQHAQRLEERIGQAAIHGWEAVQAHTAANGPVPKTRLDVALTFSRSQVARAIGRERAIGAELSSLPKRAQLERSLSFALAHLLPGEVRALRAAVSAPQLALLARLKGVARDIALGREEEPHQSRT